MGSVKITVELKCAQCGKKIRQRGKHVSGRHGRSWIKMPDVWSTDWIKDAEFCQSSITINKGVSWSEGYDDDMYCSKECVMEFVESCLPKLRDERED